MNTEPNANARARTNERLGRSWIAGVIGACAAVFGVGVLPLVADAAVPATGCPAGTYEIGSTQYSPPAATIDVPNLGAVLYVVVDTAADRFLIGNGTVLNGSTIDVLAETGSSASQSALCKADGAATTTTLAVTSPTTTPPTTPTTISSDTPTTTPTATPPTVLGATPTPIPAATPPTVPSTTILVANLPPVPVRPSAGPPAVRPTGASPPVSELPETGRTSDATLLIAVAALGVGMLMIRIGRRTA